MDNQQQIIDNKKAVLANDNSIKRQVPGITTQNEKIEMIYGALRQLKDQELFFRAIGR